MGNEPVACTEETGQIVPEAERQDIGPRQNICVAGRDRRLDRDVNAVIDLIETGALRRAVGFGDEEFLAGKEFADVAAA